MKKKLAGIGAVWILLMICCLSGCGDFAFNPIGTWHYAEHNYYADEELFQHDTPENETMMKNVSLVFQKSGTGYVDSGTDDHLGFTYEYNDKEITMTMDSALNKQDGKKTAVTYLVSDDGKTIMRVMEQTIKSKDGKEIPYREEFIYQR